MGLEVYVMDFTAPLFGGAFLLPKRIIFGIIGQGEKMKLIIADDFGNVSMVENPKFIPHIGEHVSTENMDYIPTPTVRNVFYFYSISERFLGKVPKGIENELNPGDVFVTVG